MPYILNTQRDIEQMLKAIGAASVEELYAQLPAAIGLNKLLAIPKGLSERDCLGRLAALARANTTVDTYNSFLGAGSYDHYVPAALSSLLSRAEFLTAYTPYQAEASQGILQAIYEYQTYLCLLTGMDISNASLFDGASSLAEAVLMALRITKRKKVIVAKTIHPEYRQTLTTYLSGFDFQIVEVDADEAGGLERGQLKEALTSDVACCAFQSPNFFGCIEKVDRITTLIAQNKSLSVMVTNPFSLALLKEPGACGVDIVCGDGQSLGGALLFGGPSFGFLTTKEEYVRQMPGRIVGKSLDRDGNEAYCLTLQAREQHIRRAAATSNICSNQSLNAIGAAIYLALMGASGLKEAANTCVHRAHTLAHQLQTVPGVTIVFDGPFFNEFVWEIKDAEEIAKKLTAQKILPGVCLGQWYPKRKNAILSCCTETKSKKEIDAFVEALKSVL